MSYHCCLFFKFKRIGLGYEIIMDDKLKQQIFRYVPEPKTISIYGESIHSEIKSVNTLRKFLKPATEGWVAYFPKFQDRPELGLTVCPVDVFIFENQPSEPEYFSEDYKKITIKFIKVNT